jgi:hypothetical protein
MTGRTREAQPSDTALPSFFFRERGAECELESCRMQVMTRLKDAYGQCRFANADLRVVICRFHNLSVGCVGEAQ